MVPIHCKAIIIDEPFNGVSVSESMTNSEIGLQIRTAYSRWKDYNGRSSRPEFWVFIAFHFVAAFFISIAGILTLDDLFEIVMSVFMLVQFFIILPLAIRRMHDTGRSAFWLLLNVIPLIGNLIVLIFMCLPGDEGANRYGPDPLRYQHVPGQEVL